MRSAHLQCWHGAAASQLRAAGCLPAVCQASAAPWFIAGRCISGSTTSTPQQQQPPGASSSSSTPQDASPRPQLPAALQRLAAGVRSEASKVAAAARRSSWARALALHTSSAWQQHGHWVQLAATAAAVYPTYMTAAAAMAQLGYDPSVYSTQVLAASSLAVAAAGVALHLRGSVNPDQVFSLAMRKLGRHAGLQEVMGGSLAGGDVRAYLLTAGGVYLKEGFLPRTRHRRIQMIFPLEGPAMKGVATVVARKAGGKYAFRLLCVDLPEGARIPFTGFADVARTAGVSPAAAGVAVGAGSTPSSSSSSSRSEEMSTPASDATTAAAGSSTRPSSSPPAAAAAGGADMQQVARVFLIGSSKDYEQYRVLAELRDPLIAALQQQGEFFRVEDELEEDLGHYTCPAEDVDQVNAWDTVKHGSTVAWAAAAKVGHRARGAVAAAVERQREASRKRLAQQQAAAAAAAATAEQQQQQTQQQAAGKDSSSVPPAATTAAGAAAAAAADASGVQLSKQPQ